MATVFETRLIGNLGRDATVKTMDRGVVAINFPVAHNKNWRDKKITNYEDVKEDKIVLKTKENIFRLKTNFTV